MIGIGWFDRLTERIVHGIFSGLLRREQKACPCIDCLREYHQGRMAELIGEAKPKIEAAIHKLH